jgi:predicted ATPase
MADDPVEMLFYELLDLPPEERRVRLDELRAGDPGLHLELAGLLRAHDNAPAFLARVGPTAGERPTRLGKYEVQGDLGHGAAGIVFLAHDPDLNRPVAIKTLAQGVSRRGAERLREEARTLASVVHPNVAQVYSIEVIEGEREIETAFLTMELVPGSTLAQRLREGALPLELALDYGRQIAAALEAAHLRSVVHRDLKPQNIRITPEGWVKVLDFGLAQLLTPASSAAPARASTGGTPGYMGPEQCRGEPSDLRADLWAFGSVLYECLSGEPAVRGATLAELLDANRRGEVHLDRLPALLPPRVEALLRTALEPDPARRIESATHARQVLDEELLRLRAGSLLAPSQTGEPVETAPARRRAGNLPRPLSSFIGREVWLAETAPRLLADRLLAVTGPGGVGKTRAVIELANRLEPQFPAGVWFVDLSAVSNPIDVPATILRTLRIREVAASTAQTPPPEAIARAFQEERGLLILDNCEHLLASVARFLEELLGLDSRLSVVATSRQPLGLHGEEVLLLPPLALPGAAGVAGATAPEIHAESVELFLQRARSRVPGFAAGERKLGVIEAICERLDGLPLAIELAASHARALPLEEMLRRVQEGRSLPEGAPSSHRRHRSLRELVDWSYQLLPAKEQALLRRLAIFRGGCTLAAVESVCGGWGGIEGWEACDLLGQLVERSLVEPEGPGVPVEGPDHEPARYRLLETIRAFASERLAEEPEPGEPARLEQAYLDFLVRLVALKRDEMGPTRSAWVARIGPDYANAVRGLELALSKGRLDVAYLLGDPLTYYWMQMGQWSAGMRWIDRILEARSHATAPGASGDAPEVRAVAQAGFLATQLRQHEKAAPILEEAQRMARALGDQRVLAFVCQVGGIAACMRGDLDAAQVHLEESLRNAREAEDEGAVAAALGNLGIIESTRGRHGAALPYYREHLRASRAMGDRGAEAAALSNIGWTSWALGDLVEARPSMEQALKILEANRDLPAIAVARQNLAEVLLAQREFDVARSHLLESARIRARIGDRTGLASTLASLSRLAEGMSRLPLAAEILMSVLGTLGPEKVFAVPGAVHSLGWWKEELTRRLGEEEMARAAQRAAAQDLEALLARVEAGTE